MSEAPVARTVAGVDHDTDTPWRTTGTDLAVATGTAVGLLLLTLIATEEDAGPPDVWAFLLAGLVGVPLLWRRRFPAAVAFVSLLLVLAYHALGYPALGNLPLAVALMSASYYGTTIPAVVVATLAIAGTLAWFLIGEARALSESISFVIRELAVLASVILAGSVLRSRRLLDEESRERLRLERADQEARAGQRIAEERMEIAREIHDVIAHTVALIGVQARVAADTLHDSPDDAEQALQIINDSTRDASSELRATVGVLRRQPSRTPAPRLDQIEELIDSVEAGGPGVELVRSGRPENLSGLVELVAYRVVQEALTNVVRHASATKVVVELTTNAAELVVVVSDDGIGGGVTEGFGISGMRERVEAVEGNLVIGAADIGGVRVQATIPLGGSR